MIYLVWEEEGLGTLGTHYLRENGLGTLGTHYLREKGLGRLGTPYLPMGWKEGQGTLVEYCYSHSQYSDGMVTQNLWLEQAHAAF